MSEFKIENGVPIPARGGERAQVSGTLRQLEVDQSVLFPQDVKIHSIRPLITYIKQETGRQFISRKVEGGIRVWRVS